MAARLVEVATTALAAIDAASRQADADDFVHSVTRTFRRREPRPSRRRRSAIGMCPIFLYNFHMSVMLSVNTEHSQ